MERPLMRWSKKLEDKRRVKLEAAQSTEPVLQAATDGDPSGVNLGGSDPPR
jgi:hypothetical protein